LGFHALNLELQTDLYLGCFELLLLVLEPVLLFKAGCCCRQTVNELRCE